MDETLGRGAVCSISAPRPGCRWQTVWRMLRNESASRVSRSLERTSGRPEVPGRGRLVILVGGKGR